MASSKSDHVIIIGAGLAGCALGQALRKQGISCEIFERDAGLDARFQGWAISLHWILPELEANLCEDMTNIDSVCVSYAADFHSEGVIFDGRTGKPNFRIKDNENAHFIRANRLELRNWLSKGLKISFDKNLLRYEEDADGVTAVFSDGTTARGAVLVGADGVSSHVRRQMLANTDHVPKPVKIGLIIGELTVSKSDWQRYRELAGSFFLAPNVGCRLFVALKQIDKDLEHAHYYWMMAWPDDKAAIEPYWTTSASRAEMRKVVMDRIAEFDPSLTDAVLKTPEEGIMQPPLIVRDMVPTQLPTGRVTMLGDAIHPMTPFRGEGGNQAMQDALTLAKNVRANIGSKPWTEIFKDYEAEMIPRGEYAVLHSRKAAEQMDATGEETMHSLQGDHL